MAPVVCVLGACFCLWLFMRVFEDNWHWMTAWVIVGFLIYFGYGYRNSALRKDRRAAPGHDDAHGHSSDLAVLSPFAGSCGRTSRRCWASSRR